MVKIRADVREKLNKYGVMTTTDIVDAFKNTENWMSIELKQLTICMTLLFSMLIITFLESLIFMKGTIFPIIALIMPFGLVTIFCVNSLIFKEAIGSLSKYTIIILIIAYVVGLFFVTGGFSCITNVWLLFLFAFTALTIRGRSGIVVLIFELFIFSVLAFIFINYNDYLTMLPEFDNIYLNYLSIFKVGTFISVIIICQTRIAIDENNKNLILQKELAAALTSQKLFTASMNHELRAPLNGVLGGLQMLSDSKNFTESQTEMLDASYQSANTLLHLINELLDYAKIEAGEFEIINESFSIKELANTLVMLHKPLAIEKGLSFFADVKANVPEYLWGDGTRIQQIITNLLSNAIKYTHIGNVLLKIDYLDENLIIEVCDTGEGISDEALEILFAPFKRINEGEHKKIQGTGLGMYVTHNLIAQMKGTITVDSHLGAGTTFTVTIPAKIGESSSSNSFSSISDEVDLSTLSILAIDDSDMNLLIFKKLAAKATGASITTVTSGQEALDRLKEEAHDIVFVDSLMPGMNGEETFKNIRNLGYNLPVVIVTGETGLQNEQRFKAIGFDGFLAKPINIEELRNITIRLTNK